MSFNIRKLKIQIAAKEAERRRASPNTLNRILLELKALERTLQIAIQNRNDARKAA